MASTLTAEALSRAAQAAFGGSRMLALLTGGVEETDAGYQRRPVSLVGPENDADGTRVMVNDADVIFAPYAKNSTHPVDGWALFDGPVELVRGDLLEPRGLVAGDQFVIRVGMVRAGFRG